MILDVGRHLTKERAVWDELDSMLQRLQADPRCRLSLDEVQRFQYLYERSAASLVRVNSFANPQLHDFLASLVGRAYSQIHSVQRTRSARKWSWSLAEPARTFRRHVPAFRLSLGITLLGCALGWLALRADANNKPLLLPFTHLQQSPSERVAQEEAAKTNPASAHQATFSAQLMTHNIRVSLFTLALGLTFGLGTTVSLFYNGVILGAVSADYVGGGQTIFLLGWLMPHGVVEIPAILLAGQAGFVLAGALIGWGTPTAREQRLREVRHDLLWFCIAIGVMLVWAGIVESFVSQYHRPALSYTFKIAFGLVELTALTAYYALAGKDRA